ncbi:hypothetical protein BDA99DRAFT_428782 [Phascolomyces articulosus]|uniref:EH domain-containing protein n=1 Tax=Phascolomyces articulosus TaxID=60185 RepID=A0AAD5PL66_9FUNG|nr:hypothetical protein BDA99DRAFT_428782 [Phascolomyces articulosus]
MNKLKSTFLRTHSTRQSDDRRSQQFAKKLNAAQFQSYDNTPTTTQGPPTLHLDELTEMERTAYQSWWKDLDPFSIGHLDNEAVLKFLRGCCLPDHKLEQILRFFEDTVDGLDELQFYAMLRLIAHAQNGRTISRDMVFLGGR